jgi:hypothetical protein
MTIVNWQGVPNENFLLSVMILKIYCVYFILFSQMKVSEYPEQRL